MQNAIKNGLLSSGKGYLSFGTNAPYTDHKRTNYYAANTKAFYEQNLKWSDTMIVADVQGLNYNDFYAYQKKRIRTADIVDTATGQHFISDYQVIIFEDHNIDFVPLGAKVKFGGSTWLVINPTNVQATSGETIIRRCNTVWRQYDWYGNIIEEPFCFGTGHGMTATSNSKTFEMMLMDAYQHSVMQYNETSKYLHQNLRMIIGRLAYEVRGVQNWAQEFTDDLESVHLQYFDLDAQEVLHGIDDMTNRIAGGRNLAWGIDVAGADQIAVGDTQSLTPSFIRCVGVNKTKYDGDVALSTLEFDADSGLLVWKQVLPYYDATFDFQYPGAQFYKDDANELYAGDETVPHPMTYTWQSSDENIATVDANGNVTGVSEGESDITVTLDQNTNISAKFHVTIEQAVTGEVLQWDGLQPASIRQYGSATLKAVYRVNGQVDPDAEIHYTAEGPDSVCYTLTEQDGRAIVQCWLESDTPLTVYASCNGQTIVAQVQLHGW